MTQPLVEIYIITRNRDKFFEEALNSVLELNYTNYHIIISDNSSNDNIEKLLINKYSSFKSRFKYIKRSQNFKLFEHIKHIFYESQSDYLVIFHDDDILEKNFLKNLIPYFNINKKICAIGANGITIDENSESTFKRKLMYNSNINKVFKNPITFLYQYFGYKTLGVCHHSGYIYDLKKVKKIINSIDFSSNSNSLDVYYLAKFLEYYQILYISEPLMRVRFHKYNLNFNQTLEDRLFILNKIRYEFANNEKFLISSFRYCLYFFWKKNSFLQKKYISNKLLIFRIKFLTNFYLRKIFK